MTTTRRRFLAAAGACGLAASAGFRADAADGDAKVVLLGTRGGPRVNKGPANPSNLVVAGGRSYVVDCGYGVTRQLVRCGHRSPRGAHHPHHPQSFRSHAGTGPARSTTPGPAGCANPSTCGDRRRSARSLPAFWSTWRTTSTSASGTRAVPICASSCGCTNSSRRTSLAGVRSGRPQGQRHQGAPSAAHPRLCVPVRHAGTIDRAVGRHHLFAGTDRARQGRRRTGPRGHASREHRPDAQPRPQCADACASISSTSHTTTEQLGHVAAEAQRRRRWC